MLKKIMITKVVTTTTSEEKTIVFKSTDQMFKEAAKDLTEAYEITNWKEKDGGLYGTSEGVEATILIGEK